MRLFKKTEPRLPAEVEIHAVGTSSYLDDLDRLKSKKGGFYVSREHHNYERAGVVIYWKDTKIGYLSKARSKEYKSIITGRHPVVAVIRQVEMGLNNGKPVYGPALSVMLPAVRK